VPAYWRGRLGVIDWLGMALVWATLAACAVLWMVVLGLAWLLWIHLRLRGEGAAREARLLAQPLPPDDALPHIVVQLPVFNEGTIVERAIASAARLDWPRGKLHIQVCDDSTDATTGIAQAAADKARAAGVDVVVLHRVDRRQFKAGALNAARERTEHGYFAILDVDYVPRLDFLRRCMAVLLAGPKIAFVQARPDFFNAGENALTRAQAILLDFHYGLEQPTRSWSGQALPFNGTCGIWRREAIEAGGGWCGDMLTEDWDLSYRALLAGWRGVYVATVAVPGELPTDLRTWTAQQRRWSTGIGEVAWKVAPTLISSGGMSAGERWRAFFPLFTWLGYLLFAATFFLAVAAIALKPSLALPLGLFTYVAYLAMGAVLFALMLAANRFLGRGTPLISFMADFAVVIMLCIYISWASLRSLPATMFGRRRVFERTPKQGVAGSSG
jgi:cellulose synthase/poly-beta-1,6-N-acetylglucosamine synthase-like glycosyltransferase